MVIDRGNVDKSRCFYAYSQRRFIEDPMVKHRFLFPIADIFCFHSVVMSIIPSSGPNSNA